MKKPRKSQRILGKIPPDTMLHALANRAKLNPLISALGALERHHGHATNLLKVFGIRTAPFDFGTLEQSLKKLSARQLTNKGHGLSLLQNLRNIEVKTMMTQSIDGTLSASEQEIAIHFVEVTAFQKLTSYVNDDSSAVPLNTAGFDDDDTAGVPAPKIIALNPGQTPDSVKPAGTTLLFVTTIYISGAVTAAAIFR